MAAAARPYDREQDQEPFAFTAGLPVYCGRLAGALEFLLDHPDSPVAAALGRAQLDAFNRRRQETVASRKAPR